MTKKSIDWLNLHKNIPDKTDVLLEHIESKANRLKTNRTIIKNNDPYDLINDRLTNVKSKYSRMRRGAI